MSFPGFSRFLSVQAYPQFSFSFFLARSFPGFSREIPLFLANFVSLSRYFPSGNETTQSCFPVFPDLFTVTTLMMMNYGLRSLVEAARQLGLSGSTIFEFRGMVSPQTYRRLLWGRWGEARGAFPASAAPRGTSSGCSLFKEKKVSNFQAGRSGKSRLLDRFRTRPASVEGGPGC